MMIVLDIDLDFFLDERPRFRTDNERRSDEKYQPWPPEKVRQFLTEQCNVRSTRPGIIVKHHHEVFPILRRLIDSGELTAPFHIIHIDSHADLGMGGPAPVYVPKTFLHLPLEQRRNPPSEGSGKLDCGNYLLYLLANRWLEKVTYVLHPDTRAQNLGIHDIPSCLFQSDDENATYLQLKVYENRDGVLRAPCYDEIPIDYEPLVPIELCEQAEFENRDEVNYILVAQSPDYTPATADPLLDLLREYIEPLS